MSNRTHFSLPKCIPGLMNFAVVREDGQILSFAADDNCGLMRDKYVRTYLCVIDANGDMIGNHQNGVTPIEYLNALASFLGYELAQKQPEKPTRESRPDMVPGSWWLWRVERDVFEVQVLEVDWENGGAHVRGIGVDIWAPINQLTEPSPITRHRNVS